MLQVNQKSFFAKRIVLYCFFGGFYADFKPLNIHFNEISVGQFQHNQIFCFFNAGTWKRIAASNC